MTTSYFSFGQDHAHRLNNITLDKDIIIKITDDNPREVMFRLFGPKWSMEYTQEHVLKSIKYFPRGIYDWNEAKLVAR